MTKAIADREVAFRKPYLTAFCFALAIFFVAGFVVAAFALRQASVFWVALIFTTGTYFVWLIGWQSAVRVTTTGVVVDNLLVRHDIPWNDLSGIGIRSGLAIRLKNGTIVSSLMFGGSLIGVMLGYKYTHGVVARITETCSRTQAESSQFQMPTGYRYSLHAVPWPPLAILAIMEIIAAISVITK